jgi:hypothetical protein
MADYRLVLDGLAVFVVDIAPTSGRRSMRRFPTETAALAWIAEQEFAMLPQKPQWGLMSTNRLPHSRDPIAFAKTIDDFAHRG